MTKISAASAITSLADTDELAVASSGASKKITGANIKATLTTAGFYKSGGTDVAVADGGTGASTAAAARTNLAVAPDMRHPSMFVSGAVAETFPRILATGTGTPTSGQVRLISIFLPEGLLCSTIGFMSIAAGSAMSQQIFGLYDSSYNLLRATSNDGSTAWGANSVKALSLTSTFTTTYSGLHYVGFLYVGSSLTLACSATITSQAMYSSTPYVCFAHGTGGQTTLPNPATSPSAQNVPMWAYIA